MGILRPRSRSEIDFLDKNLEKSRKDINPPPLFSYLRDITQFGKVGGVPVFGSFWHFFFGCKRFLSDYMVPACPKYISGKLRSFSKNFSKNFFHTTLFENFLPNGVSVAAAKNQPAQGLGTPKNRP